MRSFYGPHLGGDGLCFTPDGKYLLTSAWRTKDQLQVWDWSTGELAVTIPWAESNLDYKEMLELSSASEPPLPFEGGSRLYSLGLTPSGLSIVTGGSGVNEAKVFSLKDALSLARDPKKGVLVCVFFFFL